MFLDENGMPDGMYPHLWKLWSEKTGVEVELRLMDWSDVIPTLVSGGADAAFGVTPTEERAQTLDFTRPHGALSIYIYFHESLGAVRGLVDLAGFPVGVIEGSFLQDYLASNAPDVHQVAYKNYKVMVQAGLAGKLRVMIGEEPTVPFFLAKAGQTYEFKRSKDLLLASDICSAVRKGDTRVLALIQDGFSAITSDEWGRINGEWTGISLWSGVSWRLILGVGAALLLVLLLLAVWNTLLRLRVAAAVRTIQERQDAINAIVESSYDWIWACDADGVHTYSNPAVEGILGYSVDEVVGKDFFQLLHPEDREMVRLKWPEWKQVKSGWKNFLLRWRRKDGSYRYLESNAVPILSSKEDLIGFRGVDRDITDHRRAEEAMKASELTLRQIIDLIPHSIFAKDREGRFLLVNQYSAELMGTTPREAIGRTQSEMTPNPEECRILLAEDQEVLETGKPIIAREHTYTDADGNIHIEEASKIPFVFRGNGEMAILGVCLDVTDRKRAESAVKKNEEYFRSLIENSSDVFTFVSLDGSIRYSSPSVERVLGYGPGENRGMSIFELIHPDDIEKAKASFEISVRAPNISRQLECRLRHKDGTWRIVEIVGKAVRDPTGNMTGVINYRDITDRKRLEEELRQSNKMEAIGQLAGGVAHDFNNMLQAIMGYAEMAIQATGSDNPLYPNLIEIRGATQRSADLTRQLLAFARRQTVLPKVLDLNQTVSSLLKMLRRLIGEDIQLAWAPGQELWKVRIDPTQIDQILANLMVNARDAVEGVGKVTIETRNVVLDEDYCADHAGFVPGNYVLLTVSDDGCGMDAEVQARIFEPFFTTKKVGEGTGLGLSTVWGIVKQNEGFINVYSEPSKGTTFRIYFPKWESDLKETANGGPEKPIRGGTETILIVEDEPAVLLMGKRILEDLGYTVLTAGHPGEAVRLAVESVGPIHLLVTDVVMPEMNGREMSNNIAVLKPGVKVLYMSGYTADVIAHHGVLEEGVRFIQKPFTVEALAAKVREALDN